MKLFEISEHLDTAEDVAAYLNAALEQDDPAFFFECLGDVAKSKGMTDISKSSGLTREGLYKALSVLGNPEFATIIKVLHAVGINLKATTENNHI